MEQGMLAIDQGTSGTKAVLFSLAGRQMAKGSATLVSYFPQPGYVEQDPFEIYENTKESVRRCLESVDCGTMQLTGIGISNQRETFLLWDAQGKPLTRAIVWQCKRSTTTCEQLKNQGFEKEIVARTGLTIDPYFSGTKFLHLVSHDPELMAQMDHGNVWFGTIDTWLLYKLTNGAVYATDTTNASRTLFFNIHTQQWDRELLNIFHADRLHLPEIHHSPDYYGTTDIDGILPYDVPIRALIGDSHASSFGLGCFSAGSAKATLGTGTSILMNVGLEPVESQMGLMSTLCHDSGIIHYGLEGIIVSCGSTLSWLRDGLGLMADSAESEWMANSVKDNGGVYLVPAFSGLGAPYWKMHARGCIAGLTFESRKEHVVRAALESIAFQIKDVTDTMTVDCGFPLTELLLDGGISGNRFVMQLIADLVGVPVRTRGIPDVAALGVALMAGLQAGYYAGLDELTTLLERGECYNPGQDVASVKEQHLAWKNVVKGI